MTKIKTCVFPVAGLGTRFLPATKSMPKEMLVVLDRPIIQHAVEEAKAAGIERFVFVTAAGKSSLEDHFDTSPMLEQILEQRGKQKALESIRTVRLAPGNAMYVRQQLPLGLGHAVLCARHLVDEDYFAVMLPDDLILSQTPCLAQMVAAHQGTDGNMVATETVALAHTNRYGIMDVTAVENQKLRARSVIEKPAPAEAPSCHAVIGRYILNRGIFDYLAHQEKGAGGEIQLTDGICAMIATTPLTGFSFEGDRFDCGTQEGWLAANVAYACANKIEVDFSTIVQRYTTF